MSAGRDPCERSFDTPDLLDPLERDAALAGVWIEGHGVGIDHRLAPRPPFGSGDPVYPHRAQPIAATEIHPDPIAIVPDQLVSARPHARECRKTPEMAVRADEVPAAHEAQRDRKSTRLNSSH